MDLSYSQNLEDRHLDIAFAGQERGVYVDIGGGHPVADNVTYRLYRRGWSGLVVEPQRALAALYGALRPRDRVVTSLVGEAEGEAAFHAVGRFHGLSTMVETHAEGAVALGAEGYVTERRPVTTLAALCADNGVGAIDVLKIDVEGAEAAVIAGGDWTRWRPAVVLAEAIAPGSGEPAWEGWEPALLAHGYRFVLFDGLNRFYVAGERDDILARFPRERAPWDSLRHLYEIGRAEAAAHPDHDDAMAMARGLWASLPDLDPALVARLLLRGRAGAPAAPADVRAAAASLRTEAGRETLGRIAMGYDGGQLFDG